MTKSSRKLTPTQKNQLLRLCKKMIGFNSTNPHGNEALAKFLGGELKGLGFQIKFQRAKLFGAPQANLLARRGPTRGRPVILNTHLDTVTTEAQAWTKTGGNPFRATVRGGRLYGLGSADTKLAMACQIIALRGLAGKKFRRPLVVSGTYGEEVGLVGIGPLVKSPWIRAGDALNSEPTELSLAVGNKGFRIYRIVGRLSGPVSVSGNLKEMSFKGKAAHSATSHLGDNANLKVLRWLARGKKALPVLSIRGGLAPNIVPPLSRLQLIEVPKAGKGSRPGAKIQKKIFPTLHPFLQELTRFLKRRKSSGETQNLGVLNIQGGAVDILLDHRFPASVNPDGLFKKMEVFLKSLEKKKLGKFSLKMEKSNPAFQQAATNPLVQEVRSLLKSIGRKPKTFTKPGCTEASFFAKAGCRAITLGPGRAYGNIHQPNEWVSLRDLEDAVLFYQAFIEKMCL